MRFTHIYIYIYIYIDIDIDMAYSYVICYLQGKCHYNSSVQIKSSVFIGVP